MKKILLTALIVIGTAVLYAQPLPPTGHAGQGDVIGGAAPIDGGLSILILMGAAFGGRKIFRMKKVISKN
ncbi:MAG: hypothetical protein WCO13_12995 [Bacteroidota bacterium]